VCLYPTFSSWQALAYKFILLLPSHTFYMCTFPLHKTVIKQIDKYTKLCLWKGADINAKSCPKAAWEMVCLPKNEGGLGVINLRTQNEALLLKNLHKFFNQMDIPWVHLIWEKYYPHGKLPNHVRKGSFWSRGILCLLDKFKGLASATVHSGRTTCQVWQDLWEDSVPSQKFPELFYFAKNSPSQFFLSRKRNPCNTSSSLLCLSRLMISSRSSFIDWKCWS
jgi:hypothetical protein